MLLDNTLVDFHRGGWNPLEVGIGVQVDVVEAEVVAWTEREAPLAVGGDAPADVDGYVDALAAGAFDFAHVILNVFCTVIPVGDRKSTRLNSSHRCTSYAVFCLKKKK